MFYLWILSIGLGLKVNSVIRGDEFATYLLCESLSLNPCQLEFGLNKIYLLTKFGLITHI